MPADLDKKQHRIMFWFSGTSQVSRGYCVQHFSDSRVWYLSSVHCLYIVYKPFWPLLALLELGFPVWEEVVAKIHLCNIKRSRGLLQPKYHNNNPPLFSIWISPLFTFICTYYSPGTGFLFFILMDLKTILKTYCRLPNQQINQK